MTNPATTHVFAIAVESYQDKAIRNVDYAENDAREFVTAWQQLGVDPSNCVMLLSAQATHASVTSRLRTFLRKIPAGDRVIFFYAGHGAAFNDVSYVTVHDTQRGDIQNTSISLGAILKQLRESHSDQVLLFLDSCHSGLPVSDKMRSIYSQFSAEELEAFCRDSEFHVAFASCRVDEFSFPSRKLKHGIWSHCVINALKGDAKDALDKGRLVTGSSLQGFLHDEVPRVLRVTISGSESQTPCAFGNFTKEFVVADLEEILRQKHAAAAGPISLIKESRLLSERGGAVKQLRGYRKPPYPLSRHSSWEQNFVRTAGGAEVAEIAEEVFAAVRGSFGYRRKDLSFEQDNGSATIKTPDFDVNITLEQDPDAADQYILLTEVATFRRPEVIDDPAFLKIFTKYCDTVVIDFESPLDVESKIDEIEEIDALAEHLDYDAACTYFTLRLPKSNVAIHVTSDQMRFSLRSHGDLKQLIAEAHKAVAQLAGANVAAGLLE
jgi:hypothetical protein